MSSSRFSTFNHILKLKSASVLDDAPPPPPKDSPLNPPSAPFYSKSFFSRSTASLSPSLSPDSVSGPATPSSPCPPMPTVEFGKRSLANVNNGRAPAPLPSAGSLGSRAGRDYLPSPSVDGTDSSGSCPNASNPTHGVYLLNGANSSSYTMAQASTSNLKSKKSVFKLPGLAKRNRSKKDLSDSASASGSTSRTASLSEYESAPEKEEGDEGISSPWNFQHHIHVDEGYLGLPPSWSAALSQVGFGEEEIAVIYARRRAAAALLASSTTNVANHERPASPHISTLTLPNTSTSTSSSTILLDPVPRTSSLAQERDLTIHPTSMYSVATSNTGGTTLAPTPRTPSFSVKSIVSGIKSSLTSDLASTKEDINGSRRSESASGELDRYVFVDGNDPEENGNQGMGDDTLVERPFDSSSVSSHHTHSSIIQQVSEDQLTPRTPMFPHIQVHRTQSESGQAPSLSPRAPSPLSHSATLQLHHPRGYKPQPGSRSAPPRTPPRRVYHVANGSSDSYEGDGYTEPPPAYVSPKRGEWVPRKEKEGLSSLVAPPPPNRPIPPIPLEQILGVRSGASNHDSAENVAENGGFTAGPLVDNIPGTADDVLDISSRYSDHPVHGEGAEIDPARQTDLLSPTLPLVIDKRMSKLAALPPRLSIHQEDSLEDWSESLFSEIGKRSSILVRRKRASVTSVMDEKRTTLRPMSPLSMTGVSGNTSVLPSSSLSLEAMASSLPDMSLGVDLGLGSHAKLKIDTVEEDDERAGQDKTEETSDTPDYGGNQVRVTDTTTAAGEVDRVDGSPPGPSIPLPDSFGPHGSSFGKDLEPPAVRSISSSPSESPCIPSIESLPPCPPPKPKPKPAPLALPPTATLALPRTNVIPGISGKSPVNPLFGSKPQPLPIPISPSQIRAQLRPAQAKPPYPPPTLPLPLLKRPLSQPNLAPPQSHLPPIPQAPSPQKALKLDSTALRASPSDSRPNSSQTLQPIRVNSDRDSGVSTITATHATITTAKTEVVRTAVASVLDSDAVSLASQRESVVDTTDTDPQTMVYDKPDIGVESPCTQEHGEAPDSVVSETSSVLLLRDDPQSKWPAPPPTPIELEMDTMSRRISRFRTTSLGRVSQLQAMSSTVTSPINSHFSHGSSDTMSSSASEGAPLATPKAMNRVSSPAVVRTKNSLAPETKLLDTTMSTFRGVDIEGEGNETRFHRSESSLSESWASIPSETHPLLAQLRPYITPCNPASCFTNLVEIAEGESGSVFAARVISAECRSQGQKGGIERPIPSGTSHVAIKRIPLPPLSSSRSLTDGSPVSNKLTSVLHELCLLKNLDHEHLLLLDAIYACSDSTQKDAESAAMVDTSLWIRMELMERSLADVIGLVAEGLALQERLVGRFGSDILHGLDYLQKQHIAHRDVRSDNLLVNASGVVKLADFSNAIHVDRNSPMVQGAVGVIYWQAPEMRAGPYDALKVDIWSLGATVWELAETVPPFSMPASPSTQVSFAVQTARHVGSQWPSLTHPEHYSRAFHEFLRLCGRESAVRPCPGELLNTPFIRNACGRTVILQLLSQCRAIEEAMAKKEASTGRS